MYQGYEIFLHIFVFILISVDMPWYFCDLSFKMVYVGYPDEMTMLNDVNLSLTAVK